MDKQFGMIGLGKMGLPIAENLARAGIPLGVVSSNPEALRIAADRGAQVFPNRESLLKSCDVLITMLPADQEILSLYTGEGGILDSCKQGTVCIDMTSARGETMRTLQQAAQRKGKGIDFLDAPVSGGVAGAQAGTLTIMVGGERELFDRFRGTLEKVGKKIIYTGALGSAKDMKMLNQTLNAGNTCVAAEVMLLAKQLGIDLPTFFEIVNESSGGSWVFKNNVPKFFVTHEHTPGFRLDLMKKDVSLFIESAREKQDFTPLLELVYQFFLSASNQGNGNSNYTYISKWIEDHNKL